MGNYWRRIHKRAVAEARSTLHLDSRERAVTAALAMGFIVVVLLFYGSDDAAGDELIARIAAASVAILLFPFFYILKLFQVPALLSLELETRVAALEAATKPLLAFAEGGCRIAAPLVKRDGLTIVYGISERVGVRNPTGKTIERVEVTLVKF